MTSDSGSSVETITCEPMCALCAAMFSRENLNRRVVSLDRSATAMSTGVETSHIESVF